MRVRSFLLLFLPFAPALADPGGLPVVQQQVPASSALVRGKSPHSNGSACFYIRKDGDAGKGWDLEFQPLKGADFARKIYFRHGPGRYSVDVAVSQNLTVCENMTVIAKFEVENLDTRDPRFLLPSMEVQSDDPEIIRLAEELTAGITDTRGKSRAIYRWVGDRIAYDKSFKLPTDALSTLRNASSICSGYANLNAALHRVAGIRAKVIHGIGNPFGRPKETDPHAWNEVLIDGEWIIQDPTWENGSVEYPTRTPGVYTRSWFDPSPRAMELTHRKDRETRY